MICLEEWEIQSTKPLIACFDIATSTGICCGRPGDPKPFVATWDLREAGTLRPRRLLYFSNLLDEFFKQNDVDVVAYEAPMPLAAMHQHGASEDVMLLLRGAIGVFEAAAARAEIEDIGAFNVQATRKHFVGQARFQKTASGRSMAKDMVLRQCDIIGIKVLSDHEADAVAGWFYCCALAHPATAHFSSPLFAR
jgi:hypothetical protein